MTKNDTPCKECGHFAICRITDTYVQELHDIGEVPSIASTEVTIRCTHFHKFTPTVRALHSHIDPEDRHYGENK